MYIETVVATGFKVVTQEYTNSYETRKITGCGVSHTNVCYTKQYALKNHQDAVDFLVNFLKRPIEDMPLLLREKDMLTRALARYFLKFGTVE